MPAGALERISRKSIIGSLFVFGIVCSLPVFGQEPQRAQARQNTAPRQGGTEGARASSAPPFIKVEWVQPSDQKGQVPVVQANIGDPNIGLKQYGPAAKQLLTSSSRRWSPRLWRASRYHSRSR